MPSHPSHRLEVAGRYRIASATDAIWRELNNPEALTYSVRHCERVERLSPHRFLAHLRIGIGPFKMPAHADLEVVPVEPPHRYRLLCSLSMRLLGESRAEATVWLNEEPGGAVLAYRVAVRVEGRIAGYGMEYLHAAVERNVRAFFARFGEWMERREQDAASATV